MTGGGTELLVEDRRDATGTTLDGVSSYSAFGGTMGGDATDVAES
jgi:hypothetical protein